MDETKYAKAFELIMNAGNAKSLALMAVESAREFDLRKRKSSSRNRSRSSTWHISAVGYDSG